ncbi:MAG: AMP-binding protein [Bdellovibrionales bacterium]|nr:AMP-binding protein [Bdellovibrionales bacterium]
MRPKIKLLTGWSEVTLLEDIWRCWNNDQPVIVINPKILELKNKSLFQIGIDKHTKYINKSSVLYKNLSAGFQLILLTSGTTGEPKLICLDKKSILFNINTIHKHLSLSSKTTVYGVPPLFHAFGAVLNGLMAKVKNLDYVDSRDVNLKDVNSPILISYIPGSVFKYLKSPLPHLTGVSINGGDCLYQSQIEHMYKMLPNVKHTTGYGMTEAGPVITHTKTDEKLSPGFIGAPLKGVTTEVDGNNILKFKSDGQAHAIFNFNKMTWEKINDEWISTGDIVQPHSNGYNFVGRSQWSINKKGETISPYLLEKTIEELLNHQYECRVLPVQINDTQSLKLMLRATFTTNNKGFVHQKLRKLPVFFQPTSIEFVTEWPENSNGKLNRLVG